MAKTFRPMPAVQGVSAGAIATLDCPIGLTYHGLLFTMGGTTFDLSKINTIKVKGNGRTLFEDTGANLDVHNLFEGRSAASATQFYLDFERYGLDIPIGQTVAESLRGREMTAIGTGQTPTEQSPIELTTLQVELEIDGTAVAPTLSCKALQSPSRGLGLIRKRRKFNYFPSGSGEFEISDLPKGDLIDKVYIHSANDTIQRVKMETDNFLAFDRVPAENNLIQLDGVRVPQGSLFVIDPSERGRGDEMIVTRGVRDFRLKVDCNGADTLSVFVDYVGAFAGN